VKWVTLGRTLLSGVKMNNCIQKTILSRARFITKTLICFNAKKKCNFVVTISNESTINNDEIIIKI